MTNLSDIIPPSNLVTEASTDTLTNKTLTSPVLNTGVSGTAVLDEDNMASDSATKLATQQSIKAYVDSQVDSTEFVLEDDDGTEVTLSNAKEVKFIGSGITTNWTDTDNGTDGDPYDLTFSVDAAQTGITSLLATDIKIGEDDQTKIDFETADEIHFYANNVEQVYLGDNIFGPQSDSDVDLGSTGVRWKDAFVDSITVTGEVDAASLDISGNADIDGTLETDNLTIGGAQGSDGQILTSTGSGVGWENAAAGGTNGWEYISQVSASSSSTVDVEGMDSTYVVYKILAYDVQVAGSQFEFKCRFKQGGSYITANYSSKVIIGGSDSTNVTGENVSGNHMLCHRAYMGATTSEVMFIDMTIPNPSNSTTDPLFFCESVSNRTEDQGGNMYRCLAGGVLKTSGAITGVQFFPNSGTVTSGIFKLYGLKGS